MHQIEDNLTLMSQGDSVVDWPPNGRWYDDEGVESLLTSVRRTSARGRAHTTRMVGRSRSGGKIHQSPSLRKKNIAAVPAALRASTRT